MQLDILGRIDQSVTVYDREARLVYMNAAAIRPFGRPVEEMLGRRPWELVPPGPRTPFRDALEAVLADGVRRTVFTEVRAIDRWYEVEIYPHPEGALAVSRDVTDRLRADRELREREARFRGMVESAPEAILILDVASRRFVDVNARAEQLFGRTRAELLASGPGGILALQGADGPSPATVAEQFLHEVLTNGSAEISGSARGPDGTEIHVEVHARVLPSTDPQLVRASVFDISARHRAQERLAQVQRLEAIARLAGGIAHDFNNILTIILGSTQLALAELPPTHPVRTDLLSVIGAAERAALVTRQLLTFARQEEATVRVLDLSVYLHRMQPLLERLVGEDIEIVLDLAQPLASVRLDPAHVEQIILNLAANARDAMPKGGRLTLHTANVVLDGEYGRLHNGVPPGRYVLVSVADTGEGIPERVKPHIFEPFFTTKELNRGTGLGLATVHGIVQRSNGHIWVYSEPGLGSTFKMYFPIVDQIADTADPDAARQDHPPHASATIVIVEDDANVRQYLRRTLERDGYTVIEAPNAGEALLIFETHEGAIDLLITDVVMPRMMGPQLAARLRMVRPELPVIFVSGYAEDRIDINAASHDAFVPKPVAVDVLLRTVKDVLDRRKPA